MTWPITVTRLRGFLLDELSKIVDMRLVVSGITVVVFSGMLRVVVVSTSTVSSTWDEAFVIAGTADVVGIASLLSSSGSEF